MGRPTITYVHPHLTMRAGATNFVLDTAVGLQDCGWPVAIVTQRADPAIVGNRRLNIVEVGGPLPSDPRHWLRLAGLERRVFAALDSISNKILFPQVHPANYWAFTYKAARPWVPCVWMCQEPSAFVHSWGNIWSLRGPMRLATIAANPPLQILDRLLVTQSDRIVANSRFTAAAVRRVYKRSVDAIAYPPVANDAFATPNIPRDCILHLGRLTRFKRVDVAIDGYALAFDKVGDSVPPLVIAGTGAELPVLRAQVTRLGLEGRIHFAGEVSDKEKRWLFARAKVFLATSPAEPFGLVCPEAMAAGIPVIAPDRGGSSETVTDGETGILYRAGSPDELASKLVDLVSDDSRLKRMGQAARQRGRDCYTLEHTVDSLERAFTSYQRSYMNGAS